VQQFGASTFHTVVYWHTLGKVENECTSRNYSVLAIFVRQIIKFGETLTQLWHKHGVYCVLFKVRPRWKWFIPGLHVSKKCYWVCWTNNVWWPWSDWRKLTRQGHILFSSCSDGLSYSVQLPTIYVTYARCARGRRTFPPWACQPRTFPFSGIFFTRTFLLLLDCLERSPI